MVVAENSRARGKGGSVSRAGKRAVLVAAGAAAFIALTTLPGQIWAAGAVCVPAAGTSWVKEPDASGSNAVACGDGAEAVGVGSVAVGSSSNSATSGSIAIGSGAIGGMQAALNNETLAMLNKQQALMEAKGNASYPTFASLPDLESYVNAVQAKKDAKQRVTPVEEFVYRSVVGHNNNIAQGVGAIAEGGRNISIGEYAGGITTKVNPDSTQVRTSYDNWNIQNVNIGTNAGTNSVKSNSVALGFQAGYLEPGSQAQAAQQNVPWDERFASTYIGSTAGKNTAAYGNIGIGSNAGAGILDINNRGNVFIGDDAGARSKSGVDYFVYDTLFPGSKVGMRNDGRVANPQGPIIPGANTAIGPQAFRDSSGSGNTAVGRYALANGSIGSANTAVGEDALMSVKGDLNTAVGAAAGRRLHSSSSTSVGRSALAYGDSSIAIGSLAQAAPADVYYEEGPQKGKLKFSYHDSVLDGVAIGTQASALSNASIAIGKRAETGIGANAESAIAVGSNAQALGKGSIALGSSTDVETGAHDWGFGLSKDVNIPDETRNPMAVGDYGIALGTASVAGASKTDVNAIAIGKGAQALGAQSISIGTGNVVKAKSSGALGDPNYIGDDTTLNSANALGTYVVGNDNGTVTAPITTSNTFVLGNSVRATANNSIFLGAESAFVGDGAQAAGTTSGTVTNDANRTKGTNTTYTSDTFNGVTRQFAGGNQVVGVVSVGNASQTRRIQNVAPGLIGASSTDAINGSQLFAMQQAVTAGQTHYYSVNSTLNP